MLGQGILGLWKITESSKELLDGHKQLEDYNIDHLNHERRRSQFLAGRLLVHTLLPALQECVQSDEHKRPFLKSESHQISIAHWRDYAVVLCHPNKRVGVDVEGFQEKVQLLKRKFLNPEELAWIDTKNEIEHLTKCWSAKEAIYKYWGKRKLDFRQHMKLHPFAWAGNTCYGQLRKLNTEELELRFFPIENGVITALIGASH